MAGELSADSYSNGVPAAGTFWDERRPMVRSVEVVEDLDATADEFRFRSASSVLDQLSTPNLATFRRAVRQRYREVNARYICGKCRKPVYVSLAGSGHPDGRDGRSALFAHHAGTANDCDWGTQSKDPREIDREKYKGIQEGPRHKALKKYLVAALESDSSFSDSDPEKVISGRGEWRKPDVSAKLDGRLIAFDIQRATTQLPAIDGREAFYEKYNILYVWIVDTNDTHKLALQAFQDIYWNNRGQIFAFDERARDFSQENNELHLWALTVAPWLADDGVTLVWTKQLVRRSQIDWGSATQHPRYPADTYEQAFDKSVTQKFLEPRRRLINSTRQFTLESIESAGESWNEIANALGAPLWSSARDDQVFKVIGVLATAAAGQKMDASRYAETALTAMFNEFLEHGACRGWTTSLIQIADAYSHTQLLAAKSTQQKMARNLSEQHPDMARRYAGMLDVIFPKSALSRLVGPPTRIVELA